MEEEEADEALVQGILPLGPRLTVLFLDLSALVLSLPALAFAVACLTAVRHAAHRPADILQALAESCQPLGILSCLLAMILGACWLAILIRARHAIDPSSARWPQPPQLSIAYPMLMVAEAHAGLSLLAWIVVKVIGFWPTTWIWPAFWLMVLIGCEFTIRRMGKKGLPL